MLWGLIIIWLRSGASNPTFFVSKEAFRLTAEDLLQASPSGIYLLSYLPRFVIFFDECTIKIATSEKINPLYNLVAPPGFEPGNPEGRVLQTPAFNQTRATAPLLLKSYVSYNILSPVMVYNIIDFFICISFISGSGRV